MMEEGRRRVEELEAKERDKTGPLLADVTMSNDGASDNKEEHSAEPEIAPLDKLVKESAKVESKSKRVAGRQPG